MLTQSNPAKPDEDDLITLYIEQIKTTEELIEYNVLDQAQLVIEVAIGMFPTLAPAKLVYASILEKTQQYQKALTVLTELIDHYTQKSHSGIKHAILLRALKKRAAIYLNLKIDAAYKADLENVKLHRDISLPNEQKFAMHYAERLQQCHANRLIESKEDVIPNTLAVEYSFLGDSALVNAEFDLALYYLTRATSLCDLDYVSFNHRGQVYFNQHQYDKALIDFNRGLEIFPGNPHSHYLIAHLQVAQDNIPLARQQIINAFKIFAEKSDEIDQSSWHKRITEILSSNIVLEEISSGLQNKLQTILDYVKKGKSQLAKGRYDSAIRTLNHGIKKFPESASLYATRGLTYSYKKNMDTAEDDYCIALWLSKSNRDSDLLYIYRLLRNLFVETGNITKALKINANLQQYLPYDKKASADYEFAEVIANKGKGYLSDENLDKALSCFDYAIQKDPLNAHYYLDRSVVFRLLNNFNQAEADLSTAKTLAPQNPRLKELSKRLTALKNRFSNTEQEIKIQAENTIEIPAKKTKKHIKKNHVFHTVSNPSTIRRSVPPIGFFKAANNDEIMTDSPETRNQEPEEKSSRDNLRREKNKKKAKTKADKIRARYKLNRNGQETDDNASDLSFNENTLWTKPTRLPLSPIEMELFTKLPDYIASVGGSVRDRLLGHPIDTIEDYDFVANTSANIILEAFKDKDIYPSEHVDGLFKIFCENGTTIDIFINPLACTPEDAMARDFTINTLKLNKEGYVSDILKRGLQDITARLVDTVIDPIESFTKDPIRILRAIYLSTKCNLELAPRLIDAFAHTKDLLINKIEAGQLNFWIRKLFSKKHAQINYQKLMQYQLFHALFPALAESLAADQDWILHCFQLTDQKPYISLAYVYADLIISTYAQQALKSEATLQALIYSSPLLSNELSGCEKLTYFLNNSIYRRHHFYDARQSNAIPNRHY